MAHSARCTLWHGESASTTGHVVRRVRVDEMNLCAVEQPVEVLDTRTIAAQQSMVAKNPQIAWLRDGIVGRLGNVVGIGQTFLHVRIKQPGQVVLRESDQVEIEIHPLQVGQFDRQQVVIPFGQFARLVVGQTICLHLRRRQALGSEVTNSPRTFLVLVSSGRDIALGSRDPDCRGRIYRRRDGLMAI